MDYVLILLCILILYKIHYYPNGRNDYLSFDSTNAIKGIFILFVFCSHFLGYINLKGGFFPLVFRLLGQRMVTCFLLYSGFGVMESISTKEATYINDIPRKRIAKVLFNFDFAVIFYVIVAIVTNNWKYPYTFAHTIKALVAWESIGNSNWYIFAIIIAYFCTYLGFIIERNKLERGLLITFILILLYCFLMSLVSDKSWIWYDTILCYPLGMILSLYKNKFNLIINKKKIWFLAILICLIIQAISYKWSNVFIIREIAMLTFSILIVIISYRFKIDNYILIWLGRHLFSIYIMQRIPMILFSYLRFDNNFVLFYFLFSLISTLLIVKPFELMLNKVWKNISTCVK